MIFTLVTTLNQFRNYCFKGRKWRFGMTEHLDIQHYERRVFSGPSYATIHPMFGTDRVVYHARPKSPFPTVPLAISSIRSKLFFAPNRTPSSISICGVRSRNAK